MTEGHRRPLVLLPSSFGRWVVVRITVTHGTTRISGDS
jgi:hypothetical protein